MRDALSSAGSSDDLIRHMGMRGSQGISRRALPKGSSLTMPTMLPRFLDGCRIATTLAHALSSGRSDSLQTGSDPCQNKC